MTWRALLSRTTIDDSESKRRLLTLHFQPRLLLDCNTRVAQWTMEGPSNPTQRIFQTSRKDISHFGQYLGVHLFQCSHFSSFCSVLHQQYFSRHGFHRLCNTKLDNQHQESNGDVMTSFATATQHENSLHWFLSANVFVGHFWTFLDVFERFVRIFSTVFELFVHLFFVLLGFRTFSTEFRTSTP